MEEENKTPISNEPNTDILDEMIKEQASTEEEVKTLNDGSIHDGKPIEDKSIWDSLRAAKEEREAEFKAEQESINRNIIPNDIPGVVPTPVVKVKEKKGIQPIHMFIVIIVLVAIGVGVFEYFSHNYVDDGSNRAEEYTTTTATTLTTTTTTKKVTTTTTVPVTESTTEASPEVTTEATPEV